METTLSNTTQANERLRQQLADLGIDFEDDNITALLPQTLKLPPESRQQLSEALLLGIDEDSQDIFLEQTLVDWAELLAQGYIAPPFLLPDDDVEAALARQKEMMDLCFPESKFETDRKAEKRVGLATQQLQIEQRHALRLVLGYPNLETLLDHLEKCLADPIYGYGERGDQGRTLALALARQAENKRESFTEVATTWLTQSEDFRQAVEQGIPFSLRPFLDNSDIDSFVPILQRLDTNIWRLGSPKQGRHRDFEGAILSLWPAIMDAYVHWIESENATWLTDIRQRALTLPPSLHGAAWASRLSRNAYHLALSQHQVEVVTKRGVSDWPVSLILGEKVGLSRLGGHSLYQVTWDGGAHSRLFEVSNTTRNGLKLEHTELAVAIAEVLYGAGLSELESVTPEEIELAYLTRMRASQATLGGPKAVIISKDLVPEGRPVATYQVGEWTATWLVGGEVLALLSDQAANICYALLQDPARKILFICPVKDQVLRKRQRLAEATWLVNLNLTDAKWIRALCAWTCWVGWALG